MKEEAIAALISAREELRAAKEQSALERAAALRHASAQAGS